MNENNEMVKEDVEPLSPAQEYQQEGREVIEGQSTPQAEEVVQTS